jgi:hypothetical protein
MFLSRRARSSRPVVPLPDSVTAQGLDGTGGWAVLECVGQEVFTVMCGDARADHADHADYEELFEEFREDPQSVVRPALRPAVASGITVSSALVYILPVTAWLLKVAAERVAGQAVDALGNATREKITRLLGHRRSEAPGNETDDGTGPVTRAPENETDGESGPVTRAPENETYAETGPVTLDAGEEQAALTALATWAESIGADTAEARAVAEAIIKVLRSRGRRTR